LAGAIRPARNGVESWAVAARVAVGDIVRVTMDDQPDSDKTPAAGKVERDRTLQREVQALAGDPADRAEIAELRSLLGEPWADIPA
jgi:hypothetical protein